MAEALKIFLDSNVLFSICCSGRERSRSAILYDLQELGLMSLFISGLVQEEVRHNLRLKKPASLPLYESLLAVTPVLEDTAFPTTDPALAALPETDRMILGSALAHRMDAFLTGNTADFAELLGRWIGRTLIATPRQFLREGR